MADRKNKPVHKEQRRDANPAAAAADPTVEDAYWRENFGNRPYAAGERYERWRPAYQYGWQSRARYGGRKFDEVEPELRRDWEKTDGARDLSWERARSASRDAWNRVERNAPAHVGRGGR